MSQSSLRLSLHRIGVLMFPAGRVLQCKDCLLSFDFPIGEQYDAVAKQFELHLCRVPGHHPAAITVLVVEDFLPFRQVVCSVLTANPDVCILCEVSDGLEAVRRAEELQPDLILLDIGLPNLNGIAAARQIRKLAPKAKIIFVSQQSSADVVREALRLGALGYVTKARAYFDLQPAVEAVSQGRPFISSGLLPRAADDETNRTTLKLPLAPSSSIGSRGHEAHFYSDEASFLAGFSKFIESHLSAGKAVILLATEAHRNSLYQGWQMRGVKVDSAIEQGRYIPLDAADILSTFMRNDMPDPDLFLKAASDLVASATKASKEMHSRVAACGECAPLLRSQGYADAAIRLEQLWDEVARTHDLDILCGYSMKGFRRVRDRPIFEQISAAHSAVRAH
jgi:DNA-binding NarL/FixJ family response regulator